MLKIAAIVAGLSAGCAHGYHDGHYGYASTPFVVQPQIQPAYVDRQGRPIYSDAYGRPIYANGQPVDPANIVTSQAPGQTQAITPTVVAPPVIYYDDHHVDHHETHHDDHH